MKVLVVGGGGREHTIIWKLSQNKKISELYCAPGNGGISSLAVCVPIKATDIEGIVNFSRENSIDFVILSKDFFEMQIPFIPCFFALSRANVSGLLDTTVTISVFFMYPLWILSIIA